MIVFDPEEVKNSRNGTGIPNFRRNCFGIGAMEGRSIVDPKDLDFLWNRMVRIRAGIGREGSTRGLSP